jgi:hypothetical protein
MHKEDTQRIDRCLDALLKNVADIDVTAFWPVVLPLVEGCYADLFSLEVGALFSTAADKGFSNSELAAAFRFPSRFSNIIWNVFSGSKAAGLSKQQRISLVEQIFDIWALTKHGSIFNETGLNHVLSQAQVNEVVATTPWRSCSEDYILQRAIGDFNASLITYCEATHYIYHKDALEKHGPYIVRHDGKTLQLVVRDAYFLKPIDLWAGIVDLTTFPITTASVAVLYDSGIKLGFDVFNGLSSDSELPAHAAYFHIRVSENQSEDVFPTTAEEIAALSDNIAPLLVELTAATEKWEMPLKTKQHIRATWYTLSPLFALLNLPWHSPHLNRAIHRVDQGCIRSEMPKGDFADFRDFLDPRVELQH